MAGPNPYPLHTFLELRRGLGRHWIACEQCRRYSPIPSTVELWDTRTTTFSCSVCGGPGHLIDEKHPDKVRFEPDQRAWPERHPWAVHRLQIAERVAKQFEPLAAYSPRPKAPRESLPQRETLRRQQEPTFIYKSVPLPFRTFREARDFGLVLKVACILCTDERPLDLSEVQLDRPFAGAGRLICRRLRKKTIWSEETEICGRRGHLVFEPIGGVYYTRPCVDIGCSRESGRPPHRPWVIRSADLNAPPWAGRLDKGDQRFACPGCGSLAHHSFSTPYRK